MPETVDILWTMLAASLGALLALKIRRFRWLLAIVAFGILAIPFVGYGALLQDLWIPVVAPAVAWLASPALMAAYLSHRELRERQAVMGLFSTYVSERVAKSLWQQRDDLMEGGRPRPQVLQATVLFSDIRGFTPITERLPVDRMMVWLDQYMRAMTDIIVAHDGVIEKFMGDGIVAVFGVPIPRKDEKEIAADARAAVDAALEMRAALDRLNPQWEAADLPPVGIRVGITTGSLVAGSVGSSRRLQYTILGDTVNTAARLESYAGPSELPSEQDHCRILVSEATYHCLGPAYRGEFFGALTLKGKVQSVNVYCIRGRAEDRERGKPDHVV